MNKLFFWSLLCVALMHNETSK